MEHVDRVHSFSNEREKITRPAISSKEKRQLKQTLEDSISEIHKLHKTVVQPHKINNRRGRWSTKTSSTCAKALSKK
jgi:hypothetical protein